MELDKRYTINTPAGTVSPTGVQLLLQYIQSQNLQSEPWKALNAANGHWGLPTLPDDWPWVWSVERGEYAGTMPKRLSKYYYKEHGLKSPDSFLQQIGNLARSHSYEAVVYSFDFANVFDWEPGDFGDDGSCYWDEHEGALDMLSENEGLAIRFYDENGDGFARAWIAEVQDFRIVFNGYGFPGDPTLTIARILAAHLDCGYKHIGLSNNYTASGTLWINSGSGYAVGKPGMIDDVTSFDLRWYDMQSCEHCGRSIGDDETYYGPDDHGYCERCYYNLFDTCSVCGETYDQDRVTAVDHEIVCEWCLREHFATCESCDEYYRRDDLNVHDSKYYCDDCFKKLEIEEPDEGV